MHVRPYQKLIVWREAHDLCVLIYRVTSTFPHDERFRLIDQMCRSSSSVPTNLAEGSTRATKKGGKYFYNIASTSLEELHYQCLLSQTLDYITVQQFEACDDRIQRISYLLTKLQMSLQ